MILAIRPVRATPVQTMVGKVVCEFPLSRRDPAVYRRPNRMASDTLARRRARLTSARSANYDRTGSRRSGLPGMRHRCAPAVAHPDPPSLCGTLWPSVFNPAFYAWA